MERRGERREQYSNGEASEERSEGDIRRVHYSSSTLGIIELEVWEGEGREEGR